jgi:DNA repair exonuclease SbcCD ATPase subunit
MQELNLLLTSGHSHIKNNIAIDQCPLCNHKFDSNKELLSIVHNKLKGVSSQSKEEAEIHASLAKLESQQKAFEKLLRQLSKSQGELKELNGQISRANKELAKIGFEDTDPISISKIEIKIKDKLRDENRKLSEFRKQNERLVQLLKMSEEINGLLIDFGELLKKVSKEVKAEFLTIQSVDRWEKMLETINEMVSEKKLKIKEELSLKRESLANQEKEIKELDKQAADSSKEVNQINQQIELINNFQRLFDENWELISKQPVTGKTLKESALEVNTTQNKNEDAQKLFSEAEKALEKAIGLRKNEALIDRFKKELESLEAEQKRIERVILYIKDLDKGISSLKNETKEFVRSQIEPLSETISSLYLRAQGNQVINNIIASTNENGILDWIAELSEHGEKLDNMVALSQGQRQDLALAIFLARARKLGGTFFLDEPLVHLDDLNRIALLDTIRVILTENNQNPLRLVITTSSNNLVRHLREKFSLINARERTPMRIYKLSGSPKTGNNVVIEELKQIDNVSLSRLFERAG